MELSQASEIYKEAQMTVSEQPRKDSIELSEITLSQNVDSARTNHRVIEEYPQPEVATTLNEHTEDPFVRKIKSIRKETNLVRRDTKRLINEMIDN